VTKSSKPQRRSVTRSPQIEELEQEIERLRFENQAARAEMQSAQEELRSTNEEMQSANEELQSTNEELTTSKEEMQSMNEELQTVNQELQAKVDALLRTNNDMRNLLDSTDIATLFLDDALRVRRFTPHTTQIFRLLEGDVNRPITDITADLIYPELVEDIKSVVRTLVRVVKEIPTKDGRWFNTRILPYRTMDNIIDGVVLTFTDITIAKTLEAELRMTQLKLKAQIESPK
jgi:two-component system CheB/CheR fusion protein